MTAKPMAAVFRAVLLGLVVVAGAACEGRGVREGSAPLRIVVSIGPLSSIVSALAPAGTEVKVLIPAGRSLHSYEVTPADLAALGSADIVVRVGLGLDPKVGEFVASHPSGGREDVCFADVVGLEGADGSEGHSHDHGDGHDDDHGAVDPHLWLDPSLVARLVPAIRLAVEAAEERKGTLTPDERARLVAAERELLARIDTVDREYAERLAPLAGKAVVTHHDAFRRLADRYGLRIAAVIRPIESAEPTPGAIALAAEAARAEGAGAVFFEPQFDPASAERIASAAGAKLGRLDPEGGADWFELMRSNLDSLVENLGR